MRIAILIILAIIMIIAYFKLAYSLEEKKFAIGMVWLFAMMFVSAMGLFICYTLIDMNDKLEKQVKSKCPEYEKIDAYILKTK
jgi:hypothetical protein